MNIEKIVKAAIKEALRGGDLWRHLDPDKMTVEDFEKELFEEYIAWYYEVEGELKGMGEEVSEGDYFSDAMDHIIQDSDIPEEIRKRFEDEEVLNALIRIASQYDYNNFENDVRKYIKFKEESSLFTEGGEMNLEKIIKESVREVIGQKKNYIVADIDNDKLILGSSLVYQNPKKAFATKAYKELGYAVYSLELFTEEE